MNRKPEHIFDEWLILRYQDGEKKALTLLVKRWHPKIVSAVYRHTNDASVAKDLAQECWYAIIKGLPKIKNPRLFSAWVQTIASRKAIDWIRSTQKERTSIPKTTVDIHTVEAEPTDSDNSNMIEKLSKAIQTLPDKQRIVLSLFYLEGYALAEISDILRISPGTAKSRLFHAREFLKQSLKENTNERT